MDFRDKECLKELYENQQMTLTEMADLFKVNPSTILKYCKKNSIIMRKPNAPRRKNWTKKDIEFLTENYGKMSKAQLQEKMGRHIGNIDKKAKDLGIDTHHFCNKCQKSKEAICFSKGRNGKVCSPCKDCKCEYKKDFNKKLEYRFKAAKKSCEKNNKKWEIKYEDWVAMISQPCHYCGYPLNKTGSGLDRKNSNESYIEGNVCQCCSICNRAFSNYFTYEEKIKIGKLIREIKDERVKNNISINDTQSLSMKNMRLKNGGKYVGVRQSGKKYSSSIRIDDYKEFLGTFDTKEEAAKNYDYYSFKAYGDAARLNFPDEDYSKFVPQKIISLPNDSLKIIKSNVTLVNTQ